MIGKKEVEIDLLKKHLDFHALARWQLGEYARQVVKQGQTGVNQICNLLGISKDTYYNSKDPKSRLNEKYSYLKHMIEKIKKENPSYGYPRIKIALEKQYGEIVNHKLLLKLLKQWG